MFLDTLAPSSITSFLDDDGVNCLDCWLEVCGQQKLHNVVQTHLVLASGIVIRQKIIGETELSKIIIFIFENDGINVDVN